MQPAWPGKQPFWLVAAALTALAYTLVGIAALQLSIPPDYASPLFPSTGIALAAVLTYGWRVLPGVALGSLGVNFALREGQISFEPVALAVPLAIAVGASLQALLGAWLVRRYVRQPLALSEPRDVAAFFGLGAMVACVTSASVATAVLVWSGFVTPATSQLTWLTWWTGDTLGVLIGAPIALTLIGRPRTEWAPRRMNVGVTLTLVTAFISVGIVQVARWDEERERLALERDGENIVNVARASLHLPVHALEALRGVFIASAVVTRNEMRAATRSWLESGMLAALGWSERLTAADITGFELRVRHEGISDYRVFDRVPGNGDTRATTGDAVAIRYIEPMAGNAAALGVNALSIPVAREAIERAVATGRPAATAGFRLTQQRADTDESGVVVYAALYDGEPADVAARRLTFRGAVFATLRLDQVMRALEPYIPRDLSLCIVDADPAASRRHLGGPKSCEASPGKAVFVRTIDFAGRRWDMNVHRAEGAVSRRSGTNAWLFALVGLLAASMLGALLLTVTGRARRIEEAVQTRTAALQSEMRVRERAQSALQESRQRLSNILDNVPIGIVYTDLRGHVLQANPHFCELTGYDEDTLLTMTSEQTTHPQDRAEDAALTQRLLQGDLAMSRRHKRCITRGGEAVWVQSTVSLLRDADGKPRFIVAAVEDVTERLRLQEAENARELAEASSRAKSDFLSRMSHELRTPLNAILGFAQLLERDQRHALAPPQKPWVKQIQQAGWHLLEMINDVLDLSRIESGNLKLRSEPLNLAELVDATVPMVRPDAQQRRITITTAHDPAGATVIGDPTRARQIVINLLSNAVKYNIDGGSIHVATRARGRRRVEVSVIDTGIGMSAEQIADLYKPFNRLGREASARQGTGIGLVISKSLAELMGGSLTVHSEVGRGTSFVLSLPMGEPSAVDPATVPGALQADATGYTERRVHYVEDNETNIEVMRGILAQRPQIRMAASMTGADGLSAIRADPPDLVLLDMHLPDMNGCELLGSLQSDPALAAIPVVSVSADAVPANVRATLEAGARHYLTKPVGVADLLSIIDRLLGTQPDSVQDESRPAQLPSLPGPLDKHMKKRHCEVVFAHIR